MKTKVLLVTLFAFLLVFSIHARGAAKTGDIKIGVLAKRGTEICLKKWTPTAKYLTRKISPYRFKIVPLSFDEIYSAVKNERVDFIIANPSFYVELESWYGINRIATLRNLRLGCPYTKFGGVIFCRAERKDIRHLKDLRGKTFMAVKETSLGGWRAAWRELKEHGINPYTDFARLDFGGTHDAVVYAVRDKKVDAGTVRTDTLERMQAEGKIKISDFYVIHDHLKSATELPFLHSTRAYPEWPFAKLKHTPDQLAREVAIALLQMSADSEAAHAARCAGWTIPLNYQPVHECLKYLKIGPYRDFGKITLKVVILKYWAWLLLASIFFLALLISCISVWNLNKRIRQAHDNLKSEVEERRKTEEQLRQSREDYRLLVRNLPCPVYKGYPDWSADFIDEKVEKLTGYSILDFTTRKIKWCDIVYPEDLNKIKKDFVRALRGDKSFCRVYRIKRADGETRWIEDRGQIICDRSGNIQYITGVFDDITTGKQAEEERKAMESQLYQSEKLASVGQLSAGIAHEINTPTQFVGDNIRFMQESFEDIQQVLDSFLKLLEVCKNGKTDEELIREIDEIIEEIDLRYLIEEIPKAIEETLGGVERIATIVRSMKKFAHPGTEEMAPADINEAISNTITVCRNEWKYSCELITDFDESLPPVPCKIAEINQVILNMIVNAAHAIEEAIGKNPIEKGKIVIQTRKNGDKVQIVIKDTGKGIPEDILPRIFDPFFTTKGVGKGTGMGLNLAYNVIAKHAGKIDVESKVGVGTTFRISLPLDSKEN